MKTMTEIVESIKNEKKRAFAIKPQKKSNGCTFCNDSQKNRGKLPQKVAGLLALTMLAACLASCDELENLGSHETEEQETVEIPSGPLDPEDCGLQIFEYFDFSNSFEGGSYGEALKKDFDYYMSDEFEIPKPGDEIYDASLAICFSLWSYVDESYGRKNVEFDISDLIGSYWTHKIISTKTDFALVSKAPNGKLYVTGFVDGELKNDAGFIDEKSVPNLQRLSEPAVYNAMLDYARKEFFGQIWDLNRSSKITMDSGLTTAIGGKELSKEELICVIGYFSFKKEGVGIIAEGYVTEDIPEDYIDQLLANETIIDAPEQPARTWPEEETRKEPEATRYRPPKQQYDVTEPHVIHPEDVMPNWGDEEETTVAETEAEIEPEVDPIE